jgi:tetratricopeptide (TPR) repeat protein
MILTQCAVCATELGLSLGKKCGRCSTRYCGPECQVQHWKEGGHDNLCKKIKKAGGAEQYNANEKYAEAVAVAVEKCADDTKGQTCFICTQALHWKTKEGLVRGCACRGTAGFAHVSCLAEQVKLLVEEAVENHLHEKAATLWFRWETCGLCEQGYHGVVRCALGWACWKSYVGRPETYWAQQFAMGVLGNGLLSAKHHEDALSVREAELAMKRRLGASEEQIRCIQQNLATTYLELGRHDEALSLRQEVYAGRLKHYGEANKETLVAANNYAISLAHLRRFEEAKALLRKMMPVARRVLGESNEVTLKLRRNCAEALYLNNSATLDDRREAVTTLEDVVRIARRVFGDTHPFVAATENHLRYARTMLDAREGDLEPLREAVAAMTPGNA